VPIGFVLAPILVLAAKPSWASITAGGLVAAVGLAIRAWASGFLKKNEVLTTSGPYAYTRNPLYLGTFLLGIGVAVSAGVGWVVWLFAVLYLLVYVPVMIAEAETLESLFSSDYESYSRNVPLFAPRISPYRGAQQSEMSFEPSLYMKHREYRAALGLIGVLGVLAAKVYFGL
jgi:protein-S-isoprenylcysteine O-methyltransferase Ste14